MFLPEYAYEIARRQTPPRTPMTFDLLARTPIAPAALDTRHPSAATLAPYTCIARGTMRRDEDGIARTRFTAPDDAPFTGPLAGPLSAPFDSMSDGCEAVYTATYPHRKVLVLAECEHWGDLDRALAGLAAADVSIIAFDLVDPDDAYETGYIEVDDPRDEATLRALAAQG